MADEVYFVSKIFLFQWIYLFASMSDLVKNILVPFERNSHTTSLLFGRSNNEDFKHLRKGWLPKLFYFSVLLSLLLHTHTSRCCQKCHQSLCLHASWASPVASTLEAPDFPSWDNVPWTCSSKLQKLFSPFYLHMN